MQGNSRSVSTNQLESHEKLTELVNKYLNSETQKPIQEHTTDAFQRVQHWLTQFAGRNIVLDSCCGVGESSWRLAKQYPDTVIVGIDKSLDRLQKHGQQLEYREYSEHASSISDDIVNRQTGDEVFFSRDNYCVVRADVIDFWRLINQHDWQVEKHYLLYPNPYPKASQVQKRWHGTPSFKDILNIGGEITVRSNWKIYIEEFAFALTIAGKQPRVIGVTQQEPFTPFERKYWNSGQQSWQVSCQL